MDDIHLKSTNLASISLFEKSKIYPLKWLIQYIVYNFIWPNLANIVFEKGQMANMPSPSPLLSVCSVFSSVEVTERGTETVGGGCCRSFLHLFFG